MATNLKQSTPGTAVATVTPIQQFKKELTLRRDMISSMLPTTVRPEKFESAVIAAVGSNPKLLECSRPSLFKACLEAAELGLSLNPALAEADILPVWNSRTHSNDAQFRPRYMGLMKLARQSGEMAQIYAHVVREGDQFDYELGMEKRLSHKPAKAGRAGKLMTHAYCVWKLKDGTVEFEVMDRDQIEAIKKRSSAKNKNGDTVGPWVSDEEEMWRKTVVRRASKYMPRSAENFAKAVAVDNAREVGKDVTIEHGEIIVDGEPPIDITDDTPAPAAAKAAAQVDRVAEKVTAGRAARKAAPDPITHVRPIEVDGAPDWAGWSTRARDAVWALPTLDAVTAWEAAHKEIIAQAEFTDPESADAVRAAIESRTADLAA